MIPRPSRPGQFRLTWLAFLASVGLFAGLVALLVLDPFHASTQRTKQPLVVYCAAGIKAPVIATARAYEKEFGVPIQLQYGGSQTLLSNLEVAKRGDLYLPADDAYILLARDKGLLAEVLPLARMKPVLAVPKGNPLGLKTIEDLTRKQVKLAQANPDAAAVGKLARDALQKHGKWAAFEKQIVVQKPTVNDVANDVQLGAVDAGIVWDATIHQYPELESINLPEFADSSARVSIGVLTSSEQPTAALHFARYLAARDRGLPHFKEEGFEPVEGDAWADVPELRLDAGAMLRPAIDQTVTAFEEREGVKVTRVYNGCGILVAQMKAGQPPDAYFACDQSFMDQVHDLFVDPVAISVNQLVILVHKGNPLGIRSLRDLGKSGVRVGIGHEKQCAMGVLTQETLRVGKVQNDVMKNVVVQSPTGDLLVNQMRTKSLDAAVAYLSNAAEAGDELDAIPIDIPCAFATQPVAVGKDSPNKHLAGRLVDALRSQQSRERFEQYRFRWLQAAKKP